MYCASCIASFHLEEAFASDLFINLWKYLVQSLRTLARTACMPLPRDRANRNASNGAYLNIKDAIECDDINRNDEDAFIHLLDDKQQDGDVMLTCWSILSV